MYRARISSLLGKITVLVVICCCCLAAQAKYWGGSGTPEDPYQIRDANHMQAIGADSNDWDKHFKLMADIDLSAYTGTSFNIIGTDDLNPFGGVFDGNGHTISNFSYTSASKDWIGLFGCAYWQAEIKDLGLIDPDVEAGMGNNTGTLVGMNRGNITNCYVKGGSVSGYNAVGGLVGWNPYGKISDCYVHGGSASGASSVGGLVGLNRSGIITNCYTSVGVSGSEEIGGLVGLNEYATIANCYSTGRVLGTIDVGGLVGDNYRGTVRASFWDIETSGKSTSDGGVGKTTLQMQDPNTFMDAGWDFVGEFENGPSDLWAVPESGGYLILWWQLSPLPLLPTFSGGAGTKDDPYLISTNADLNRIGHNPRLMGAHFKLIRDIDLAGLDLFIIGNEAYPYTGVFDGNGHTISNFTHTSIPHNRSCVGLFALVSGVNTEIKNLGLIDPNIDAVETVGTLVGVLRGGRITDCYVGGGSVSGSSGVGGLVGLNSGGKITNCYSTGSVLGYYYYIGGLVGLNSGTITNSYSIGSVSGDYFYIGGLVGENNDSGTIANCHSKGSVSGDEDIGGLVGYNGGTITKCYSSSTVSGKYVGGLVAGNGGTITNSYSTGSVVGYNDVGGLVGSNWGETTNCYSTGSASGVGHVGGMVGRNWGETTNCYSTASVSGKGNVGGLVGHHRSSTIANCYSTGSVSGEGYVGGLVGYNRGSCSGGAPPTCYYGTIINCYSTGSVEGTGHVGGLAGYDDLGSYTKSFWDNTVNSGLPGIGNTSDPNVIGESTANMQTQSTFTDAGWDFVGETFNGIEDIWFIPQQDYPHLWWEGMQVPIKLTPRKLNCRSQGNWVKAHLTLPQGFTVADVDPDRSAVLHSFGFQSLPLYIFVNKNKLVEIEAAFEREAVCSLAGDWPEALTVAGFLADGNIFLGTSTVRIIHPGMKVIEELASCWLQGDCVHPTWCDGIDMNRDSIVNLLDYALLMNINVEFVTAE